jgi:hypothetical protein
MNRLQTALNSALAILLLLSPLVAWPGDSSAIPVEVVEHNGKYQLLRGGQPYEVRGAGLEFSDPAFFVAHGGNSVRTWRTDEAVKLLTMGEELGFTVLLCIEIGRERHGFDYDDEEAVAKQLEYARGEVLKYKDHPALLGWIIGNEMNLHFRNPKVFDAINDISRMIHELDPNHPTTTALAGINGDLVDLIAERAPDLDFISVQMYGDIVNLPGYMRKMDFEGPYMVTEWGAIGHWEVAKTRWGAPIEQNSSDKAANYRKSHEIAIAPYPDQVIGSYVFLWGQKQERTPTWYGMLLEDGSKTETIDVMHHVWTGSWPENRAPQVRGMTLDSRDAGDNITLEAGESYAAQVSASDPESDPLEFSWVVMEESRATQTGGDREDVPQALPDLVSAGEQGTATLKAPSEPGPYRLFVYFHDGKGNAGHANIPFLVE